MLGNKALGNKVLFDELSSILEERLELLPDKP